MWYNQGPQPQVVTHKWEDNHYGRGSPQRARVQGPHQAPQCEASGGEPQECLALKASGTDI